MPLLLALHSVGAAKISQNGPAYLIFSFRPKACTKLAAQMTGLFNFAKRKETKRGEIQRN